MNKYEKILLSDWSNCLNKNIQVELYPGYQLVLDYLEWDSHFFNRPSYFLNTDQSLFAREKLNFSDIRQINLVIPPFVIWAKLPLNTDPSFVENYQNLGAKFVETEINLRYFNQFVKSNLKPNVESVDCIKAFHTSFKGFSELGNEFYLTRFHRDQQIDKKLANNLWVNYFNNFRCNRPDKHVFLALENQLVVGAILISETNSNLIIDVAVIKSQKQGKGIGSYLMQTVIDWCLPTGKTITVSSQHRNVQAVNYYIKMGFSVFDPPRDVFHWWNK